MRGPGKKTNNASRRADERALMEAFAGLGSAAEAMRFVKDLATPAEIEAFAERWRIARMLADGEASYRDIAAATGSSTTTIGRVARFLNEEPHGGYRLMLERASSAKRQRKKT